MIKRDLFEAMQPYFHTPEAVVITGMRRVGKTTLLHQIEEAISRENTLFLDLENPINQKYFEVQDYERIVDQFRFLGLDTTRQAYVFLDEVQLIHSLPSIVKYLADHHKIKFFLSGSSSFYLKNHFTESLAGRKYIFELFPLSFREYVRLVEPKLDFAHIPMPISRAVYERVDRIYESYLRFGGFPGIAVKSTIAEKELALQDIFSSYFQLEVVQLGEFRKPTVVRDLILLLMERTGSKLDTLRLSRELGVSRDTVARYLDFLEDTYFISRIAPFSRNRDTEIRAAKKVYVCDTGLLRLVSHVDAGALLENAVYQNLRTRGTVQYYQRKSGVEMDFILDGTHGYEVKKSGDARDYARLRALATEIGLTARTLISRIYRDAPGGTYPWMV